ncbi:restriction endonuclease subunit S [Limosilactobacillus reuteri]|uniref:restriction endonuclease subunit S n=1 Tax=Limosilactobacillus reuteri TaxID=1598 RepID=UPI002B1CAD6D|nr:restriction endonuclease subunit S [Limosilactobacillus reuteri]
MIFIKVRINVKWEQHKLDALAKFSKGKGYSKKDVTFQGYPLFLYGRLYTNYSEVVSDVDTYTSNLLEGSAVSNADEVVLPDSGETAEDIARASWINKKGIILGGGLLIIHPDKYLINSGFLSYSLSYGSNHKKLSSYAQGKSIVHIHSNDLKKLYIFYPSRFNEQSKIFNILNYLENLITLQQRKLNQLKRLKTAMLQQLLANQSFPKVRFNNFKNSWKDYRLGEVFDEFSVKSKRENEYKLLSSTTSGMESRSGRVSGHSNIGYKVIDNGDIVLSPQNLWLGNINLNNMGKGIVSPSYHTFKIVNANPIFVNFQLKTKKMLFEYKMVSVQGASVVRRNLDMDAFKKIVIKIPNEKEQIKIASLFSSISNIINNHQNKLTQLTTLKKYLLQKMFI